MCGSEDGCKRTKDLALSLVRDPNPMVANHDDGLRRLDADRNLDGAICAMSSVRYSTGSISRFSGAMSR
jgi:hypothetical protein